MGRYDVFLPPTDAEHAIRGVGHSAVTLCFQGDSAFIAQPFLAYRL